MHKRSAAEIHKLVSEIPEKPRDRFPISGHHLYAYLYLVSAIGASASPTPPRIAITRDETATFRHKYGIRGDIPLVGLNPGAEYGAAKRWPSEYFIQAATRVERMRRSGWILTGAASDLPLAQEIAAGIQNEHPAADIHNLAGRTSLRELCIALELCAAVLTNDTGPMHLAAALGTPVIVPFGSTSPELTGPGIPGDERHRLILGQAPCAPCFRRECPIDLRCLRSVQPETMAAEVLAALRMRKEHTH
jgi:heptosyltransferase-2